MDRRRRIQNNYRPIDEKLERTIKILRILILILKVIHLLVFFLDLMA